MNSFYRLTVLILVGWGSGWFVARSHAGNIIRAPLAWLATKTEEWAADGFKEGKGADNWPDSLFNLILGGVFLVIHCLLFALSQLVQCAACSGFWIGAGLGIFYPVIGWGFWGAIATGAVIMGVNALLDSISGSHAATERLAWLAEADREELRKPEGPSEPPSSLALVKPESGEK